ncbi:hypothetical protein SAMN05444161_2118 [Rhizobiales bacterium GAS191]|nr:hypothetical protein SAMN05519103_01231 [Rhizobiales bacterium GAS113]SEC34576.1 hypothetical protein SAMN05519104_1203 [Rhizobiales bacterium GAS188]SEC92482.1 hypothetical protein SAMN05444161_2118 [Rhizobiales bacterium GAS191]
MFESAEVEKIVEMTIAHTRHLLVEGTVRVDIAIMGVRKVAAELEEVSPGHPAISRLMRFQDGLGLASAIDAAPPSSLQA